MGHSIEIYLILHLLDGILRKIYIVSHLLDEIFFFHLILHLSDGNFEIC